MPVLIPEAVVEPETNGGILDFLGRGVAPSEASGQIVGVSDEEDHIGNERDDQQHDHQVENPTNDETDQVSDLFAALDLASDRRRALDFCWVCERPWRGSSASRKLSPK